MKRKKEHGFTLVEMLVALMIAGIFFSIFVGVVLATFETLRSGDERTVAQQNARVGLNYIANDIHHANQIAPVRLEAFTDYATGSSLPLNGSVDDPFDNADAYPIFRRSVDSADDSGGANEGIIDLDYNDGEYDDFRDDDFPYDVRALAPNRLSLTFYGTTYYPNTQYWAGLGVPVDLDGNALPNPTAANTRVTYEHQLVPPMHQEIYEDSFSGREKQFQMVVNRTDANAVQDTSDFVITRSFEIDNPRIALPDTGETSHRGAQPGLGDVDDQVRIDDEFLRQPVADHVVSLRFRYWYINGNDMVEIRYDPDEDNIGGSGIDTNDGFYRYFDVYGDEIYVFHHPTEGAVPLIAADDDETDLDNVPPHSFFIYGGLDGTNEFWRGVYLFEGWKFVNAVSITVKTANSQTLNAYRSSVNTLMSGDVHGDPNFTERDYGMGFTDFGLGAENLNQEATLNAFDPFFQAVDNVRVSTVTVNGQPGLFDFVEPNMNPNYNASAFTSLQTFVVPPALDQSSEMAIINLLPPDDELVIIQSLGNYNPGAIFPFRWR